MNSWGLAVSSAFGIMAAIRLLHSRIVMALFGPRVGHEALFDEVCKYHDIDKKAKALLQVVTKKYQMQQPVQIFIEQDTLTRALNDSELSAEHEELQKLYDAWFVEQSLASRRRK
jgi:hypothetical protein